MFLHRELVLMCSCMGHKASVIEWTAKENSGPRVEYINLLPIFHRINVRDDGSLFNWCMQVETGDTMLYGAEGGARQYS